jgi:hypothetical protein
MPSPAVDAQGVSSRPDVSTELHEILVLTNGLMVAHPGLATCHSYTPAVCNSCAFERSAIFLYGQVSVRGEMWTDGAQAHLSRAGARLSGTISILSLLYGQQAGRTIR